ncbi:ABC transporter substrate-binding protein [Microbacterium mangrovi]|uniref:ABC transporter substrate-binding protein n=1 Tax=Microbacterium mangrovi TaxID=1348253 RepID=A0A0B2AEB6_9MICO|nr:extracellular solute-binding protein [Microbacterium mangrovi]KHK99996.1 ABC transporter substrate-binding protein [Microbacterium mangrovi]
MAEHRATLAFAAMAAVTALALAGCSSAGTASGDGKPSGDITFLTNRTDLQTDGTWAKYIAEFNKVYPDVHVKVQGHTNYEDDVKTLLSSPHGYGDVLMIPNGVPANQFPDFFEPLGKTADLAATDRFLGPGSYDGKQYGIALGGNANGILYNTEVWKKAGIAAWPTSSDQFLADLQQIKQKTDATPYYTNYKDGWPLGSQWTNNIGAVTADANAQNAMTHDKAPWKDGTDIYAIDSLLFDVVHQKLSESDPLTTNWEQSKSDFATGKIGAMVLGSWAISQFQAAAKTAGASADTVGFMPFPASVDGVQSAVIGGDYKLAINKNSQNQAAGRAWLDWLLQKSGFTADQGMISAIKAQPLPGNLAALAEHKVKLLEVAPAPKGEEGLLDDLAAASKIDLQGNIYRQKLVDIARGQAPGTKESAFAQLKAQWGHAVTESAK